MLVGYDSALYSVVHFDDVFNRDKHTPLHLSAAWGLEKTVQCLMEHNADINAKVIL